MDPYWGSLHCVGTLIVPLLTQMYKWVLVGEQGWQGAAEVALSLLLFTNKSLAFMLYLDVSKQRKSL